jgi:hypothetical protein
VFSKPDAMKKQCRIVPMMVLPGNLGGVQVSAPNCAADECMHWRWTEQPSALDPSKGRGMCALDSDYAKPATKGVFATENNP